MYIIKIKGKARIPDYIQIRDDNFVLIEYFRADRQMKNPELYGFKGKLERLNKIITEIPYGVLKKLDL